MNAGGFDAGFEREGFETKWVVEWDPKCQTVLRRHFPHAKMFGDINKVEISDLEPVDVITWGFPCFPAGTRVMARKGHVNIEDLRIGDMVLTHRDRYMPVTSTMNRTAPTIVLSDGDISLPTTEEHPFYSVLTQELTPEWIPAKDMCHRYWCSPTGMRSISWGEFSKGPHQYRYVRTVSRGDESEVFNVSVQEDESYTANGIVVHNCTDVSHAGKRRGLIDEKGEVTRSGLFFRAAELIRGLQPRSAVFENVPGLLSSDRGTDFGRVLVRLAEIGYGPTTWLTLDSQFFGVAQRRRRVFGISSRDSEPDLAERCAIEVLALEKSMRGNPAARGQTWQESPTAVGTSTPVRSGSGETTGTDGDGRAGEFRRGELGVLKASAIPIQDQATRHAGQRGRGATSDGKGNGLGVGSEGDPMFTLTQGDKHAVAIPEPITAFSCKDNGRDASEDIAPTLRSMSNRSSKQNGGGQMAVVVPDGERPVSFVVGSMGGWAPQGMSTNLDQSLTLEATNIHGVAMSGIDLRNGEVTGDVAMPVQAGGMGADRGMCINSIPHVMQDSTADGAWWDGGEQSQTLTSRCHDQFMPDKANFAAVVIKSDEAQSVNCREPSHLSESVSNTLQSKDSGYSLNSTPPVMIPGVATGMVVRRLMPSETERLQGFQWRLPDGSWSGEWTDWGVKENGEKVIQPDSARYKQMGNAVTVNVAQWLARLVRTSMEKVNKEK